MVQARRGPRMPRRGTVTDFDVERGLGTVTAADGTAYPFHCTAIADESRRIDPGTAVTFAVAAGHQGRWEARSLQPLPA
jgi:cold shock CspA family protein